jgi:hypothetical protein
VIVPPPARVLVAAPARRSAESFVDVRFDVLTVDVDEVGPRDAPVGAHSSPGSGGGLLHY